MKIGVFGGSFNPVHNSHILIINEAISKLSLDKLIVVPNYSHPKKIFDNSFNSKERLDMLGLCLEDEKIELSSLEIDRKGLSYTFDTLKEISLSYPNSTIYFITGSDTLNNIENWYMGDEILKKYVIAYFDRLGLDISEKVSYLRDKYESKIILLDRYIPPISSKMIRDKVKNNESISEFLPKAVEEYILNNGLYKD